MIAHLWIPEPVEFERLYVLTAQRFGAAEKAFIACGLLVIACWWIGGKGKEWQQR